jgi:putative sterol carrier protein
VLDGEKKKSQVRPGPAPESLNPTVSLSMSDSTFVKLLSGGLNGIKAFNSGSIKVSIPRRDSAEGPCTRFCGGN